MSSSRNGFEVLVKAFLRWLVIIWADAQHTINTFEVAILQLFDNGSCIVAATAYEDGYLSAYCVNHQFLDFLFLFCGQCGCLACCCENAEKIGTVVQLIFHEAMKRLVVNLSVLCKGVIRAMPKPLNILCTIKSNVSVRKIT